MTAKNAIRMIVLVFVRVHVGECFKASSCVNRIIIIRAQHLYRNDTNYSRKGGLAHISRFGQKKNDSMQLIKKKHAPM